MITEVTMKRELFGYDISQKSKSEMFSATDLSKAGNIWRITNKLDPFSIKQWLARKSTKEFIKELEKEFGSVIIRSKGKNSHTWVHPFLFIDLALAISPKLKIEVYSWIMDKLIEYRNNSGDSYKSMCGSLYINASNKSLFSRDIKAYARRIKKVCNVENWQEATESQLKLRDRIHENIALLSDVLKDNDNAVKIAILKATK